MKIAITIFWVLDAGERMLFYYMGLRELHVCHVGIAQKAALIWDALGQESCGDPMSNPG